MELRERVLEPELMEGEEQADAYAQADYSEPHQAFVREFADRFPGFVGLGVLDLGCGPADVTIRFARAYPGTRVLGVDGSAAMLARARERIAREGLAGRVAFEQLILPSTRLPERSFDAVIASSLLHHLHEPLVLWRAAVRCARPDAPVFVKDLRRPQTLEQVQALVELYAADAPAILRRDFENSLLASFTLEEVRAQLVEAGLAQLEVAETGDRHLLVWGRMK